MGRKQGLLLIVVLSALVSWSAAGFGAGSDEVPRMKIEELKPLLGSKEVVVLDVRFEGENAPKRILGSVFENPEEVDAWSSKYPKGKKIILYCS
jgi:hypothetical protein